jgi:hypothetical protein
MLTMTDMRVGYHVMELRHLQNLNITLSKQNKKEELGPGLPLLFYFKPIKIYNKSSANKYLC